jgi:ESCRT-II complex subunit VPS36
MGSMKASTGHSNGEDSDVNKILKDIGFVSVVTKDEAGSNYIRHLASDLYNICSGTLFKTFGGMVPLLDLFYFYNKKRQIELVSPEELLEACMMFQKLGFKARLVNYPNNIKMIE